MKIIHNDDRIFSNQSTTPRRWALVVLAAISLLFAGESWAGERYAVIVNRDNPAASLSRLEAKQFFLRKKDRWSDSQRVMPVDIQGPNETRSSFLAGVLQMNETGIRRYWIELMYQRAIMPPKKVDTEEQAIKFVSQNRGAIGFVSIGKLDTSDRVKAVFEY